MRGLSTLIRMHRWQLDERRRQLMDLETLREDLSQQIDRLADDQRRERQAAEHSLIAASALPHWLDDLRRRRERLVASLREVEQQIAAMREEIAESFGELKKHETALAAFSRREDARVARVQQVAQDELALQIYRQRA